MPHIRICDLVVRVFKEHLYHTPVSAFGINRIVHFDAGSFGARDRLGRTLAPVEPWGNLGLELGLDEERGGMLSLKMLQGKTEKGWFTSTVEPSKQIGGGRSGVYVGCNDHYDIKGAEPRCAGDCIGLLEQSFEVSLSRSEKVIEHIMSLVQDGEV